MLTKIWQQITDRFGSNPKESVRQAGKKLGVPKSTIHHHRQRTKKRHQFSESEFWDSESGQNFIKRLMVSAIYTFGIKGGIGAGRIEEFMKQIRLILTFARGIEKRLLKGFSNKIFPTCSSSSFKM